MQDSPWKRSGPLAAALGLLLAGWLLVRPWGEYPLNDDWFYARVSQRLAETGRFVLDYMCQVSLVGQAALASAAIRVFGFSHLLLRGLTMLLACVGLWAFDRLLRRAGVGAGLRLVALLSVAFNPLFFYLSATFMSEIYGLVPALLAAELWFRDRQRRELRRGPEPASSREAAGAGREAGPAGGQDCQAPAPPILDASRIFKALRRRVLGQPPSPRAPASASQHAAVSWGASLGVGLLAGLTFWVRQTSVLIYPALLGATGLRLILDGDWRCLRATLPRVLAGSGVFLGAIGGYVAWSQAAGRAPAQFAMRLDELRRLRWDEPLIGLGLLLLYTSAFCLPLLLLAPWRGRARARMLLLGAALLAASLAARAGVHAASSRPGIDAFLAPSFPYLGNVLHDTGLGPITLVDTLIYRAPGRPRWPAMAWRLVELGVLLAPMLWSPLVLSAWRSQRLRQRQVSVEVLLLGANLAVLGSLAAVVGFRLRLLDRHLLPVFAGLALAAAVLAEAVRAPAAAGAGPAWKRRMPVAAVLALAGIGWFSVAGLHDHFRWNDARWTLVHEALERGASPATLQAGFEVSGWLGYDEFLSGRAPEGCIGPCRCAAGWFCRDSSWFVGMNVPRGYERVRGIQPRYWLASGPELQLLRRRDPARSRPPP